MCALRGNQVGTRVCTAWQLGDFPPDYHAVHSDVLCNSEHPEDGRLTPKHVGA